VSKGCPRRVVSPLRPGSYGKMVGFRNRRLQVQDRAVAFVGERKKKKFRVEKCLVQFVHDVQGSMIDVCSAYSVINDPVI